MRENDLHYDYPTIKYVLNRGGSVYYARGLGVLPQILDTSLHTKLSRINSHFVNCGLTVCAGWLCFFAHNKQEDYLSVDLFDFCYFCAPHASFGAVCAAIIHILRHFISCILVTFMHVSAKPIRQQINLGWNCL